MDVMKEEGNVMVGVIVCRLRRQGQHRQSMDDLRLPRGHSGSPHLTSHRQEPGPSRRIFFGNFQGRDFILEPSSDLNEINGAMLRVAWLKKVFSEMSH